ncbi:MAG: EAL domain-containing response regulator [Pseudomonadota bacterium]
MDHLLIIDHDHDAREFAATLAAELGYKVSEAMGLRDGLSLYEEKSPTVLLVDLSLRGGDGIELLRALAAKACDSAIILISKEDERVLKAAKRLGERLDLLMSDTLRKPIAIEALETALERTFGGSFLSHQPATPIEEPPADWVDRDQLLEAIRDDQMELYLQPVVECASVLGPEIVGCEGFVRWRHPEHGLLPPSAFLPWVEEFDLLGPLTELVLATSIALQMEWQGADVQCPISFNLSASQLSDITLPDRLGEQVEAAQLDPSFFIVEVTEQAAMADTSTAADVLTRLRLKGFRVSLDHFGTGRSSLVELYRMPLSELKIGRELIAETDGDRDARVVVRALIALAQTFDIPVCAESVETKSQARFLRDAGCSYAQGFAFAEPLPPDEFLTMLFRQGLLPPDDSQDPWEAWLNSGS